MSYPYDLDLAFGSESSTSDPFFVVSLAGKKSPDPSTVTYTVSWPSSNEYTVTSEGYDQTTSESTISISVDEGSSVSLTIVPAENYKISSYTVDGETVTDPQTPVTVSIQDIAKDISISVVTESAQ